MSPSVDQLFRQAFADRDVAAAAALLPQVAAHAGFQAHPLLRACVEDNGGHCYDPAHLLIADLLIPAEVRAFRDTVLADRLEDVRAQLRDHPDLISAEFTAGRGIAQAIHHWQSVPVGELLLDAGADINALTTVQEGETPLGMQVRFGTVEGVRFLLERGADPNLRPWMHMPSDAMAERIRLLLDHGWDLERGSLLLHDANHGHGARVRLWLQFGADPNLQDESGRTALHLLAARGTGREAIRALAAAGADLNHKDRDGRTPLDVARGAKRQAAAEELTALGAVASS